MPAGAEPPTGREVRANGVDVRVEILRYRKLRLNSNGGRVYELILMVTTPSGGNFVLQVGNPVPPEAVSLVVPGQQLPAKLLERDRRALLIDWSAALAELQSDSEQLSATPPDADGRADHPGEPEGSTPVS
jgi:hypothetical protein